MDNSNNICPVCGFASFGKDEIIYEILYMFCRCCSFQFNLDDQEENGFMVYRKQWIKDGLIFDFKFPDQDWSLAQALNQLDNLQFVQFDTFPDYVKEANRLWTWEYDPQYVAYYWHMKRQSF